MPQPAGPLAQADPDVLDMLTVIGEFSLDADNLAQLRSRPIRTPVTLSDAVERRDYLVPGPPGAPGVAVRVHRPRNADAALPCLVSMHGGGYVMGTHLSDDGRFDAWGPRFGCVGVSVGYRLAPETPFPGPLEDCYAALRWAHQQGRDIGVDPARIGVIGGSAGGGLAAGLTLLARDRAEVPISFQLLVYPMIDDRQITASSRRDVPVWGPAANKFGWQSYLGSAYGSDAISPYAAPARAADLAGLPPAFVIVGSLDGFLDEDIDYARRLLAAGVPAELYVIAGAPHGFDSMMPGTGVTQRARQAMEAWLDAKLHPAA
jgi:acetyl esterase/lipase